MKTLITLIFVLTIGVAAQAQDKAAEVKVETIEMTIVTSTEQTTVKKEEKVARLYRRANSKVKKALSFSTRRNRSKLA
ncbi:hypothetical protein [Lentiprolixibacter aurantiacus]|uniref:Uncharacterized protein n=1 Tax=Lentiprolixibacter aurantiacus TaxID=2993939 RepID=A0AAE3SQ22_9FLAO|nr:hypothetical protein [Lentiprolixibacter aurantiacus]MCX2720062.1 hypothetical protein [Lentiprolixibacter aurantiacus]